MKPRTVHARLVDNIQLAPHTFVLRLEGCSALAETLPGQFVMVRHDGWGTDPLLPRAFSLLRYTDGGIVDLLVKANGKAGHLLEAAQPGSDFRILGPLGRSFEPTQRGRREWLVAGGVGLAPLQMQAALAQRLGLSEQVTMFYGGRSSSDLVLCDDVRATGVGLVLATEDGSEGHHGFVTDAVTAALTAESSSNPPPTVLACGPEPMLEAVAQLAHRHGLTAYLSLEGEMACGIGACLVCAVPCASRPYRYTCVDGPVFSLEDLRGPYAPQSGVLHD